MEDWAASAQIRSVIPLRLHTDFSLLRAMVPIEKYCTALKERGYQGGAITDFDCAFGWVDFYFGMKKAGLKPILGTCIQWGLDDKNKVKGSLSFLVLDAEGFHNLCVLLTAYSLGNLSTDQLIQKSSGLALLVSPDHPHLKLESSVLLQKWPKANLYFEIQRHEGSVGEADAVAAAARFGGQCVATQPVYYLDPEDHLAHEVMLSIGAGTTLQDEKRPKMPSQDFHLKPTGAMEFAFHDQPDWIKASDDLFARVKFDWKAGDYHIPKFVDPETGKEVVQIDDRLDADCWKGLEQRLELVKRYTPAEKFESVKAVYEARLKEECEIIHKMRFSDYFLVVADFIKWSKTNGIPVGPGRGSGAGSLAAYCLSIVDIDPVRYNLLFERFLNPERVSMPDFDVDFCVKGRDQVINYVRKKYNLEGEIPLEERLKVAQIITFGKMKSKAVIRDVGRALGIPYGDVDAIAKLIPNVLNISLSEAFEKEPEFENLRARDPKADELLRIAERLENLNRHASVHAAGVVIADDLLTKYIPLYKGADDEIISQFEMKGIEKLGLLKFDFLGLRNLTVIQDCIRLTGKEIDLLKINYDDPKVMGELSSGDTVGIFQLESSGMRDVIRRLKPSCLEDIIAIVALYRPGPLEGGMVDDFIMRKQGKRAVEYDAAVLEPILKETYGVFVYQEQVMKTANVMAGFSLGEADLLRRAMGKKIAAEMAQQREKFVEGAVRNKHPEQLAQRIFDLMSEFAKYGFNKSHAAAYAMVTVQTGYLKTYYPEAFFASLLSSESEDTEKLGFIIRSAQAAGIEVLAPHVNHSDVDFALEPVGDKTAVRFGLGSIKNHGENVARAIVKERIDHGPYKDFEDFFKRSPFELLNKRQAECLIRSGALDNLGTTRSTLFASLDSLMANAQADGKAKAGGQFSLFVSKPKIKTVEEWPDRIRLNDEKALLGTYMTGHPLKAYQALLQSFKTKSIQDLIDRPAPSKDVEVSIAGLVLSAKEIFTKKGSKMAFLSVEDRDASIEVVVFPDLFEKKGNLLGANRILLIKGQVSKEGELTKILARDMMDLSNVEFKTLSIRLKQKEDVEFLEPLAEKARKFPGPIRVKIQIPVDGQVDGKALKDSHVTVDTPIEVQTHPELMNWLESRFGEQALRLE